jgi:hypothetical protein
MRFVYAQVSLWHSSQLNGRIVIDKIVPSRLGNDCILALSARSR